MLYKLRMTLRKLRTENGGFVWSGAHVAQQLRMLRRCAFPSRKRNYTTLAMINIIYIIISWKMKEISRPVKRKPAKPFFLWGKSAITCHFSTQL
jgi:hypothetical protein